MHASAAAGESNSAAAAMTAAWANVGIGGSDPPLSPLPPHERSLFFRRKTARIFLGVLFFGIKERALRFSINFFSPKIYTLFPRSLSQPLPFIQPTNVNTRPTTSRPSSTRSSRLRASRKTTPTPTRPPFLRPRPPRLSGSLLSRFRWESRPSIMACRRPPSTPSAMGAFVSFFGFEEQGKERERKGERGEKRQRW